MNKKTNKYKNKQINKQHIMLGSDWFTGSRQAPVIVLQLFYHIEKVIAV